MFNPEKWLFLKNTFHKNFFWMTAVSIGVKRTEDGTEKILFGTSFHRKNLSKMKKKLINLV